MILIIPPVSKSITLYSARTPAPVSDNPFMMHLEAKHAKMGYLKLALKWFCIRI